LKLNYVYPFESAQFMHKSAAQISTQISTNQHKSAIYPQFSTNVYPFESAQFMNKQRCVAKIYNNFFKVRLVID